MSTKPINIIDFGTEQSYNLKNFELLSCDIENKILFCQSTQSFKFKNCKGVITNTDNVLQNDSNQSVLIENVIGGSIPSGFDGKLKFKIKLTQRGLDFHVRCMEAAALSIQLCSEQNLEELFQIGQQLQFADAVKIDLYPVPNGCYTDKPLSGIDLANKII